MASASVPGVHSWGNRYGPSLLGVLRLSPCHGDGLQAPFLFGRGGASLADHMRPQGCISSVFQHQGPTVTEQKTSILCKSFSLCHFCMSPRERRK